MPKMLGHEVRVIAAKVKAIKAVVVVMVVVMVVVIFRPVAGPMLWIPMINRGMRFISLTGINQGHQVILSIKLMRLS